MSNEMKNAKLSGIQTNNYTKEPELLVSIYNPLSMGTIERNIRLWCRKPGSNKNDTTFDANTMKQTERQLRESLGDDSITLSGDPNTQDPNDIYNWVRRALDEGKEVIVKEVYQNEAYLNLGQNGGSEDYGSSKYMKYTTLQDIGTGYNPNEHRLPIEETLTEPLRQAVKTNTKFESEEGSVYSAPSSGKWYLRTKPVVMDPVIQRSNNPESVDPYERTTREELVSNILSAMNPDEAPQHGKVSYNDMKNFLDGVKNPETTNQYGFTDLVNLVGGMSCNALPGTAQYTGRALLDKAERMSIGLLMYNPHTNRVFRTSLLRAPSRVERGGRPQYAMEFLAGDIAANDIVNYLSNIGIPDFEDTVVEAINEALDGDVRNMLNPEFGNPAESVLALLRAIFNNREITIGSGLKATGNLGAYINKIGNMHPKTVDEMMSEYLAEQAFSNTEVKTVEEHIEDAVASLPDKEVPEPKDEVKQKEPEVQSTSVNPWEAKTPETPPAETPGDNPFKPGANPFAGI